MEVVRDRIADFQPVLWDFLAQEIERLRGEFPGGGVTLVVRHMLVHPAPQPLDRVQIRAISRDEMQPDPAAKLGQPILHKPGLMIARVDRKNVDCPQQGWSYGVSGKAGLAATCGVKFDELELFDEVCGLGGFLLRCQRLSRLPWRARIADRSCRSP